jgi:hypothetical protein
VLRLGLFSRVDSCSHASFVASPQEDGVCPKPDRGSIIEAAVLYIRHLKYARSSDTSRLLAGIDDEDADEGSEGVYACAASGVIVRLQTRPRRSAPATPRSRLAAVSCSLYQFSGVVHGFTCMLPPHPRVFRSQS